MILLLTRCGRLVESTTPSPEAGSSCRPENSAPRVVVDVFVIGITRQRLCRAQSQRRLSALDSNKPSQRISAASSLGSNNWIAPNASKYANPAIRKGII
jgi:hypothetical protein